MLRASGCWVGMACNRELHLFMWLLLSFALGRLTFLSFIFLSVGFIYCLGVGVLVSLFSSSLSCGLSLFLLCRACLYLLFGCRSVG